MSLVICCLIAVASTAVAKPWKPPQLTSLPRIIGLPELLFDANGRRITTPDAWGKRRADISAMIQHFEYGHLPPRPDKVWATNIERHPFNAANVVGLEERLTLRIFAKWQFLGERPTPQTSFWDTE